VLDAQTLIVTDPNNGRIRRVNLGTQTVGTVAGGNLLGFSPDGTTALGAKLGAPAGVATAGGNTVFYADKLNNRIMKFTINPTLTGTLTTVAGSGVVKFNGSPIAGRGGYGGDGGPANAGTDDVPVALLNAPIGVARDQDGNIYIGDSANHRVRKLTPNDGNYIISTIAGTGAAGISADGPASLMLLNNPTGVAARAGAVFVVDQDNNRVLQIVEDSGPVIN
jgi:sugar lactone lactonase YvrE